MEILPAAQFEPAADSQLAPTRHRDDGWTAQRQRAFLEALAACGSVSEAARSVGMSRESAYALRRRSDARAFVQAWDAARALAVEHLTEVAWDRALNGQLRPVYYHGEQVGEIRHFDNRLLLALIAQNRAAAPEPLPAPLEGECDHHGTALTEAQQLEIGCYSSWWDEDREEWLTNWPEPEGFAGDAFWIDEELAVLGPYDPEEPAPKCKWGKPVARGYARTLADEERTGLERLEGEEQQQRAARIELYRRASFGLASTAERASILAANRGNWRFPAAAPQA